MVALIVSISGVVGGVSGIVVSNRYNYALKNYGFSQGDIGKMMITFADTRSYLRAAIGYQDENLVNSCAENYEKKKESCLSISYKKVGWMEGEVIGRTRTSLSGTLR